MTAFTTDRQLIDHAILLSFEEERKKREERIRFVRQYPMVAYFNYVQINGGHIQLFYH